MIAIVNLPTNPGVYLFKNKREEIIYIGKAKNLKKRVSSYFSSKNHSTKTKFLVSQITDFDHIIVDNEVEALLLENKLIKNRPAAINKEFLIIPFSFLINGLEPITAIYNIT